LFYCSDILLILQLCGPLNDDSLINIVLTALLVNITSSVV